MLNTSWFKKLRAQHTAYEAARRRAIKDSGDALSLSKRAIFALHRDDTASAGKMLLEAEKLLNALYKLSEKNPGLEHEGSFRAALEEYAEAKFYFNYLSAKEIGAIRQVALDEESYLAGLADLTGELARRLVIKATDKKYDEARLLKSAIGEIVEALSETDLTGYLRQKFDQAKQNLRRAEEVLYDLSLRTE